MQCLDFQRPHSFHFPSSHPTPRFCIFRPGGTLTPLIPVDELPLWLQVGNWNPGMYRDIQPVSMNFIPRDGEYDVICHHCSSSVDSLHQSVSETNEDSPRSAGSRAKNCPGVLFSASTEAATEHLTFDPQVEFTTGGPYPVLGQSSVPRTPQSPDFGGLPIKIPIIPGMTFQMVPTPVLSQLPSNTFNSSPSGSDGSRKARPRAATCPPPRPNLDGVDPGESDSLAKLSVLPPPAVPLECEQYRARTSTPSVAGKHPLSPDTQGKISHAIAASLCSVSVENDNLHSNCLPGQPCQRNSAGQISDGNIVLNIAASLPVGPASVANESVASAPLIAALDHFKEIINLTELSRQSSAHHSGSSSKSRQHSRSRSHSRTSFVSSKPLDSSKPLSRASSKSKRRLNAAQKRRERAIRRREKKAQRLEKVQDRIPKAERRRRRRLSSDSGEAIAEAKPEQVNSYTKRRDRREKMAQGRKNSSSQSRYVHMKLSSQARPNVSGH